MPVGGRAGGEVSQEGGAVIRERLEVKIPGNHHSVCRCLLKPHFRGREETIMMVFGDD